MILLLLEGSSSRPGGRLHQGRILKILKNKLKSRQNYFFYIFAMLRSCSCDIIFINLPDREARVGRGWTAIRGCEAAGRGSWPQGSLHPPRVTAGDAAAETRKYHITVCGSGRQRDCLWVYKSLRQLCSLTYSSLHDWCVKWRLQNTKLMLVTCTAINRHFHHLLP